MSGSFSWSRAGDGSAPNTGKQMDVAKQTVPISDQLQRVYNAWDPQSPQCAFQHYFYNRVPAEHASQYVMPPGQDPRKWEKAMLARPDPASVPVLAVGFTDLEKRTVLQNQQVNAYRVRLHEINDKLAELSNRHDLHTTVKLLEMRERHAKLARRALALAVRIQVLSNRSALLTPQEELLQRRSKELIQQADDPAVFGSLNEAWARVKALKRIPEQNNKDVPAGAQLEWEKDREQLETIVRVLAAQQKGITFLAQTLADDTQEVNEELGLVPRKPKQKAMPASAVAPQAFAADVPVSVPISQPAQNQQMQQMQQPQQNQPAQQNQLGGGLFGGQNAQPGAPAGTQTGGGLFGSKPLGQIGGTGGTSGGLFGNTSNTQSSGGLFGQKPPSTGTGGLFGQSNTANTTNTQSGTGGGLFGQNNNTQSGGLFGQNNQSSTGAGTGTGTGTGGLFGQNNQSNAGATGTSGGLFGQNNNTQSSTGGGLFGQNNAQSNTGASGGLFGQNNNTQSNTGGGLFGQNNNTQSNTGASGGLFGQNNNTQPSTGAPGGIFGQSNNTQSNTGTSGGLFGQNNSQPSGGGLFGQNNNTQSGFGQSTGASGGLFGQNNAQSSQPAQPSGGLFGQNTQPAGTNTGGGLFGQKPAGGLFGQSSSAPTFGFGK